jgi:hypothetical protein
MGEAAGRARPHAGWPSCPPPPKRWLTGPSPRTGPVAATAARDLPSVAVDGLDRLITAHAAAQLRTLVDDYAHAVAPDSLTARQERAWPPAGWT